MAQERNLLLGVFAVQLKLVTAQELAKAGALWAADQTQDLGQILHSQGAIDAKGLDLLYKLIAHQLEAHGGDEAVALQTFGGSAAVNESFAASIVYDSQTGVKYRSIGGETPKPDAAPKVEVLSDKGQLTTEHPGRYTIKGEQGRGGVGRVLIAVDEHIGREIALKELLPASGKSKTPAAESPMRKSATMTARFLREARITGQLEHPGIVPVYEVGKRSDETVYYTMKLVRGETLADRLQRCRDIGDRLKLLPHFLDLCQAIAYAHSRGVIHRDIKPGNVMIGEFGETVLLDWGLAKVKGQKDEGAEKLADEIKLLKEADASETVAGKPIGTPSYMSPEQADGLIDKIDEKSDVWSLGAVLYELLTGQPPFTGVTALDVIGQVLTQEVTPVLEMLKDAPSELAAITEKCLQRTHGQRYSTVEQLAEDVNAFLSGGLVSAYTYSTRLLMQRWVRRNWVGVTAVAAVFLVLAVSLVVLLGQNQEIQEQKEVVTKKNEELVKRGFRLLANSMVSKGTSLKLQHNKLQAASLLLLQASIIEGRHFGEVSSNTINAMREQLGGLTMGSEVLLGHEDRIEHVDFSPDGKLLASASWDNHVLVWQVGHSDVEPIVLSGHEDSVEHVSFSPDGKLLASSSYDHTLRIWQVSDLTMEPKVLKGHTGYVRTFSFSPDGRLLASASDDRTVRVWKLGDLTAEPKVLGGHNYLVDEVSFSPDGKYLVTVSDSVRVWKTANLEAEPLVLPPFGGFSVSIRFSPNGNLLATWSRSTPVLLWDVDNLDAEPQVLSGSQGGAQKVDFSPDRDLIFSALMDKTIRVWKSNHPNGESQVLGTVNEWVSDTSFSPNGEFFATSSEDLIIRLWQVGFLEKKPQLLRGHSDSVPQVRFSPDSRLLASPSWDHTIRMWNIEDLAFEPQVLKEPGTAIGKGVEFSRDGQLLVSIAGKTIEVRKVDSLQDSPDILLEPGDRVRSFTFNPDGTLLAAAVANDTVCIWQMADLKAQPTVLQEHFEYPRDVYFSPDGKLLAVEGNGKTVPVWKVDDFSAEPFMLQGHEDRVYHIAFSPKGNLLATASKDRTVRVWQVNDLSSEPQVLQGHEDTVTHVTFSPDGALLVSASNDNTARIWPVDNLSTEPRVLDVNNARTQEPVFSPDGELLVLATRDNTINVWNVNDLSLEQKDLRGHEDLIFSVRFSPDGTWLASASWDETVRIWKVHNMDEQPQVLPARGYFLQHVSFSPDGNLLASQDNQCTVRVWQTEVNELIEMLQGECYHNLTWEEWQSYIGKDIPYERTVPDLQLGEGVPFEGAIASETD